MLLIQSFTETGKPRVRSDIGEVPYWKYAKQVYFGLTPYHEHAGVTSITNGTNAGWEVIAN